MQLHPNAREQVLIHLNEGLTGIDVKNGMFLDRVTVFLGLIQADNVLPKQGAFARSLDEWIGDLPLLEFCSDTLANELLLKDDYLGGDDRRKLQEIVGYENAEAVAQRLVDAFESLPWTYNLTVELAADVLPPFPDESTNFALGEKSQLVASDLLLSEEFPLTSEDQAIQKRLQGTGLLALIADDPMKWRTDAAFFQTQVEGFIGPYGGGNPMDRATSQFKSFLGLGLAIGLFNYESNFASLQAKKEWIVHQRVQDKWLVRDKISLDEDDSRALRGLKIWDKFGLNYPEDHKIPWLQKVLSQVSAAMASPNSATLRLAAQWFWDSYKGTDEVLRYVRRMTTLEILLGEGADTSAASLSEILGNRLAYLIGRSHNERADVQSDFKKIYNVRSRILHRGKHRLVGDERGMLLRLEHLCQKALKEEAKIVAA